MGVRQTVDNDEFKKFISDVRKRIVWSYEGRMSRMKIHEMLKIIYEDTTMYGYNAKAYKYNINRIFYTKITDSMGNTTLIPMQQWNNEPPEHLSIGNAELKHQDAWEVAKKNIKEETDNAGTGTVPYETDGDGNELDDNII